MMFTGQDNAEEYGEIFEWGEHPEALDWLQSGRGLSSGNGLDPVPRTASHCEVSFPNCAAYGSAL
ncbi:hypothetical protein N7471_001635 [Penicillium samsonianum]|uniref:uncharacterized protein n=1 Tax=Penicillium samsonianum TaxID=1882272 RepID=UPI0025486F4C|nr:uncharacterized protein N7471_001635 [Penicillium samsonianum]KAJ6150436.1 hypothetical protein N7471_001635 [Penicillium samsonianum]